MLILLAAFLLTLPQTSETPESRHGLILGALAEQKVEWHTQATPLNPAILSQVRDTLRARYFEPDSPHQQFEVSCALIAPRGDTAIFLETEYELGRTTRLFALEHGNPILLHEEDGYIFAVHWNEEGCLDHFLVCRSPAADWGCYSAHQFGFSRSSDRVAVAPEQSYVWSMATKIRQVPQWSTPVSFTVKASTYNLRSSPLIDSRPFDPEYEANSNTIGLFGSGDRGIAVGEATDTSGRIWWLVIMNSRPRLKLAGIQEMHLIGWMSSRYLQQDP